MTITAKLFCPSCGNEASVPKSLPDDGMIVCGGCGTEISRKDKVKAEVRRRARAVLRKAIKLR